MKPLKTLQLGLQWFPENGGGLDRVFHELWRALPAAGIGFHGLVAGSAAVATASHGQVRAFAPPDAALPRRLAALRTAFATMRHDVTPDLIVSHFALYTVPVVRSIAPLPFVIHFQGPWAEEGAVEGGRGLRYAAKHWVESAVYKRAGHAIVLSQAFANVLAEKYRFPPENIHIIPGGINVAAFTLPETQSAARARLGLPQGRPIIVAVRRLVPRMGLENLIQAVGILRQSMPDVLLCIAGKGMLATRLAAQVAASGLAQHIKLLGFVADADLAPLYRAADISVVPTIALEGFGLIAAESLAAGTPCLVTPIGGLPEVVAGLSSNLVMPSAAVADIAEALRQALQGHLHLPDAATCQHYAAKNFSWNVIADAVANVYRQAAAPA